MPREICQDSVQLDQFFYIPLSWPLDGIDIVKVSGEEMDGAKNSSLQWRTIFLPAIQKHNQTSKSSSTMS